MDSIRCLITRYEAATAGELTGLPQPSPSQVGYGERVSAESRNVWEYLIVSPKTARLTRKQSQWFVDNPLALFVGFEERTFSTELMEAMGLG